SNQLSAATHGLTADSCPLKDQCYKSCEVFGYDRCFYTITPFAESRKVSLGGFTVNFYESGG
ncbi:MAG: hypothetical protein MUP68_05485, partial [Deltaproteobacteria bacterium]|nr:hypothetical protein [Deltaproteobacteria bacterium]